jgi:hypothetical protein
MRRNGGASALQSAERMGNGVRPRARLLVNTVMHRDLGSGVAVAERIAAPRLDARSRMGLLRELPLVCNSDAPRSGERGCRSGAHRSATPFITAAGWDLLRGTS